MATGAWGTEVVERTPIKAIPLINEVHIDGLVRESRKLQGERGSVLVFTCAEENHAGVNEGVYAKLLYSCFPRSSIAVFL